MNLSYGPFSDRLTFFLDSVLIRIIVWRSEKDLDHIKSEYAEHFGEGLATSIREETSGDYETALISMIEGNFHD